MAENSGRKRSVRGVPPPGELQQQATPVPPQPPGWAKQMGNKPLSLAVGGFVAVLLVGVVWTVVGSKPGDAESSDSTAASDQTDAAPKPPHRKKPEASAAAKPPLFKTIACKVYTHQPGFFVLVDGELARDSAGKKLTTPCEVGLLKGNHTLTVVREKFRDLAEEVSIVREQTFEWTPTYAPFAEPSGFFASKLGLSKIGEPVDLAQVNAGGPGWDPFLSADGLTLWLAGQKAEGKGIYVTQRKTLYDEFGPAELVAKNSDRPASPSVTGDGLVVAYTLPAKAQIRALARSDLSALFKSAPVLRLSDMDEDRWLSAQISADGKTLHYTAARGGKIAIHVIRRKSLRKPFDGDAKTIRIPGGHPRLTEDGLRQFWFDGQRLFRASRTNLESPFSEPENLSELGFDGYTKRDEYRQYCVSDDEQWLIYSDDPQTTGKLYAVRVADGPRWGYAPTGKPIAQREMAQAEAANEKPDTTPHQPAVVEPESETPQAKPDPHTAPLPYGRLRDEFERLIAAGDYAAARERVNAAQSDPALAAAKSVLAWDREDADRLVRFRGRVDEVLAQLKPGDLVKSGNVQIEFEKFEDGAVSGKTKGSGKPVTRSIAEFAPLDLVGIVDKRIERNDEVAQLEIATFLSLSPKVSPQQLQLRFDRAGAAGKELAERKLLRQVHLIEQEIARDNVGTAMRQIEQLIAAAPKSRAAVQAGELRESLSSRIMWRKVGRQKWGSPNPGEFATTGGKFPESYLAAPGDYRNFVLTLEWKTTGDTAQGGVYFRYKNSGELRKNALKIHVIGDYATRSTPDHFSTGSLFGVKPPKSNPVKPNGEWNTLALRVEGDRVRVTINGVEVLDTTATGKTTVPRGVVCLDGEFTGIAYRKILIYDLPGEK